MLANSEYNSFGKTCWIYLKWKPLVGSLVTYSQMPQKTHTIAFCLRMHHWATWSIVNSHTGWKMIFCFFCLVWQKDLPSNDKHQTEYFSLNMGRKCFAIVYLTKNCWLSGLNPNWFSPILLLIRIFNYIVAFVINECGNLVFYKCLIGRIKSCIIVVSG